MIASDMRSACGCEFAQKESAMTDQDIMLCSKTALFARLSCADIRTILTFARGRIREVHRNECLLLAGQSEVRTGIVLHGKLSIVSPDQLGAQVITEQVGPLETFAEVMNCLKITYMPVSVYAKQHTRVLIFDLSRILALVETPEFGLAHEARIAATISQNTVRLLAQKTKRMRDRVEVLSKRSTKAKLAAFLLQRAAQMGIDLSQPYTACQLDQSPVAINTGLSRTDLAAMLAVNRSALSRELSRLQQLGVLTYAGQSIQVHNWPALQGEVDEY